MACAAEKARRIRIAAAAAGLDVGSRLRRIKGEHMFDRWRWGRVPMDGGGWLVTFKHDTGAEWDVEGKRDDREVRYAVMQSQFGWGVYAACEYAAEERIGWYDGEEITAEQWEKLGKYDGREHTVRASWASKHTEREVKCMY